MKKLIGLLSGLIIVGCGGGSDTALQTAASTDQKRATDTTAVAGTEVRASGREIALGATQVMSALKPGTTVVNGNFESGSTGWTQTSTGGYNIISNFTQYPAFAGAAYAWLGGYSDGTDVLQQVVAVPTSGKLQFQYHITTEETLTSRAYDTLVVELADNSSGSTLASLVSFSNLTTTSGWTLSPEYDLSAFAGRTVRLRFTASLDVSDSTSFRFDDISIYPSSPITTAPVATSSCSNLDAISGWWWNAAESGRGFAVERQGNQLFTAAFLYEDDGAASWYTSQMTQVGTSLVFSGNVTRHSGGQTLLGSYRAPTSTVQLGVATLTFADTRNATLNVRFNDGSETINIALQRFPISSPAFAASQAGFQSGWWWNENEGGRGYFIEVQANTGFVGAFMYDDSGQPTWYVSSANIQSGNASGTLQRFAGGQTLSGAYRSPYTNGTAGQLAFSFTSTKTGVMTLPNGKTLALKRFEFNPASPPGSDCTPAALTSGGTGNTSDTGGSATTGGSGSASSIGNFAGGYSVSASDGTSGSFTVDANGNVTSCRVGVVVNCTGKVTLNGSSGNANFTITGNDGQTPVDTRATLTGTIGSSGTIGGSYSANSQSEGSSSGSLRGERTSSSPGTNPTTPTPGTNPATPSSRTIRTMIVRGESRQVTSTLLPSDGVGNICGIKLYHWATNFSDSPVTGETHTFYCNGGGVYTLPSQHGGEGGQFEWGYAIDPSDTSKIITNPWNYYQYGSTVTTRAATIYINWTSGSRKNKGQSDPVAVVNGQAWYQSGPGYISKK